MPVLNHHIVSATDSEASARYYCDMLGLPSAVKLGEFAVLKVSADLTLDFIATEDDFDRQHYAFLVTETEFDEIFTRIQEGISPTGPIRCTGTRTRSTPGTTAAEYTSTTPTVTDSRSSPAPTRRDRSATRAPVDRCPHRRHRHGTQHSLT
jgi:hypothetical protein